MSQNNTIQRTQHDDLEYRPGGTTTVDLAKSHYYEDLGFLIDYTVTPGTGASPVDNGILDLIEDIEIRFNGEKSVKSISLPSSHFTTHYRDAAQPQYDPVDWSSETEQTGVIQTDVNFLVAPGLYVSMMPSFQFSTLDLRIKWASESDIADAIASLSATASVESRERLRSSVKAKPNDMGVFKENERRFSLDATGVNTYELPIGNRYHSVAIQVLEDGTPSDDLVDRLKVVENGVETHKDTTWSHLRADNYQDYNLESLQDGFAVVNYGIRGDLDDVINSRGMDQFELELDTGGTSPTNAEVRVVTRELM